LRLSLVAVHTAAVLQRVLRLGRRTVHPPQPFDSTLLAG